MPCCESCFIIHSKTKSFASLFSSLLSGLNMDHPEVCIALLNGAKGQEGRDLWGLHGTNSCCVQCLKLCFSGPCSVLLFPERSHRTNCSNPFFVLFFFLPVPFLSLSRWTFKAVYTHCCFSVTSYLCGGSSYISATIMFWEKLLDPLEPSLL